VAQDAIRMGDQTYGERPLRTRRGVGFGSDVA